MKMRWDGWILTKPSSKQASKQCAVSPREFARWLCATDKGALGGAQVGVGLRARRLDAVVVAAAALLVAASISGPNILLLFFCPRTSSVFSHPRYFPNQHKNTWSESVMEIQKYLISLFRFNNQMQMRAISIFFISFEQKVIEFTLFHYRKINETYTE